jgi:hypothetical protein
MKPLIIMNQNPKDNPRNGDTHPLPAKKNFKSAPSASKLTLTCSGICMNGPILEHYQVKGETINSARYSSMPEGKLKLQFAAVVADLCPEASGPSP